jgi:hypothetical protein
MIHMRRTVPRRNLEIKLFAPRFQINTPQIRI